MPKAGPLVPEDQLWLQYSPDNLGTNAAGGVYTAKVWSVYGKASETLLTSGQLYCESFTPISSFVLRLGGVLMCEGGMGVLRFAWGARRRRIRGCVAF